MASGEKMNRSFINNTDHSMCRSLFKAKSPLRQRERRSRNGRVEESKRWRVDRGRERFSSGERGGERKQREGEGNERGRGRQKIRGSKKDKKNGQEVIKPVGLYCEFYYLYYMYFGNIRVTA